MKDKVLVVAVHPDDETLGCGGTLLRHKSEGNEIHWLICTTINKNNPYYTTRNKEISEVVEGYQFDSIENLDLQSMQLDQYSMSELVTKISQVFKKIRPNIIYLPFKSDVHSDHRSIFQAAYSATKCFRYPFIKKIYMMETLSETEFSPSLKEDSFIPNVFVDISEYIDKKARILEIYKSEIAVHPFPRSITNLKALATYRGATCGHDYAEAFMLLKEIY